jgi:hypothetical protein
MKKMKLAVLALVGVLAAGNAMAADTATLTVEANVIETCSFVSGSYSLDFDDLDPATPINVSKTVEVTVLCSNGTTYSITDDATLNPLKATGGSAIVYTLEYPVIPKATGGNDTITITGKIDAGAYDLTKEVGAYSATATLSFNL